MIFVTGMETAIGKKKGILSGEMAAVTHSEFPESKQGTTDIENLLFAVMVTQSNGLLSCIL
jgi:hypothetical protein